jgi:hypothetical protein
MAFNKDQMAMVWINRHLESGQGVVRVWYLPENSGEREIRLVELNASIDIPPGTIPEPIEFGVDRGLETEHSLIVLDIDLGQLNRLGKKENLLPEGWVWTEEWSFPR